jgi:hypothetical protein
MVPGGGDLAAVGEHTDEVLAALGLDAAAIAAARGTAKAKPA